MSDQTQFILQVIVVIIICLILTYYSVNVIARELFRPKPHHIREAIILIPNSFTEANLENPKTLTSDSSYQLVITKYLFDRPLEYRTALNENDPEIKQVLGFTVSKALQTLENGVLYNRLSAAELPLESTITEEVASQVWPEYSLAKNRNDSFFKHLLGRTYKVDADYLIEKYSRSDFDEDPVGVAIFGRVKDWENQNSTGRDAMYYIAILLLPAMVVGTMATLTLIIQLGEAAYDWYQARGESA